MRKLSWKQPAWAGPGHDKAPTMIAGKHAELECTILPGTKSSSPIIEPRPTSSGTEPSKIDPHQAFNAIFQFATTTTDKFSIPVQSFQHRLETHQGPPLLNFIVPTSSPAPKVYLKKRHLARSSSKRRLSCLDLTGSREIWNVMEEISA